MQFAAGEKILPFISNWSNYCDHTGTVLTEHIADEQLTSLGESMDDPTIHDRDLAWLKEADCLVAEVTTPSLGVGFEIGKATEWGLRVLCGAAGGHGSAPDALRSPRVPVW